MMYKYFNQNCSLITEFKSRWTDQFSTCSTYKTKENTGISENLVINLLFQDTEIYVNKIMSLLCSFKLSNHLTANEYHQVFKYCMLKNFVPYSNTYVTEKVFHGQISPENSG